MLLWNAVDLMRPERRTRAWSTEMRSRFAVNAFTEVRVIQEAVDIHQCNLDTSLIYLCREFLYKYVVSRLLHRLCPHAHSSTRMTISYEFRRYVIGLIRRSSFGLINSSSLTPVYGPPIFTRRQAEEWRECMRPAFMPDFAYEHYLVYYQFQIVKKVQEAVKSIDDAGGHLLTRRPFQVQWFATQVSLCLSLYEYDQDLFHALDLAKGFLIPLDTLNVLWPCPGTQPTAAREEQFAYTSHSPASSLRRATRSSYQSLPRSARARATQCQRFSPSSTRRFIVNSTTPRSSSLCTRASQCSAFAFVRYPSSSHTTPYHTHRIFYAQVYFVVHSPIVTSTSTVRARLVLYLCNFKSSPTHLHTQFDAPSLYSHFIFLLGLSPCSRITVAISLSTHFCPALVRRVYRPL